MVERLLLVFLALVAGCATVPSGFDPPRVAGVAHAVAEAADADPPSLAPPTAEEPAPGDGARLVNEPRMEGNWDSEASERRWVWEQERFGAQALEPAPPEQEPDFRAVAAPPPSEEEIVDRLDLEQQHAVALETRLACIELQGEHVSERATLWGEPELETRVSEWTVQVPDLATLMALRDTAGRSDGRSVQPWPASPAPQLGLAALIYGPPPEALPAEPDLRKLRHAAATTGADALFLFGRTTRVVRYRNGLGSLIPLAVGVLLPTEEILVAARAEGVCVDVRSGAVLGVAQGLASETITHALVESPPDVALRRTAVLAEAVQQMAWDMTATRSRLEDIALQRVRRAGLAPH